MTASASFLVNEIYPCLQGEGPNLGRPSLLVRFQICNLRCTWCDTPYTHTMKSDPVNPDDMSGRQKFRRMSLEDLVQEILQHNNIKHIIFTGGEPTLQNLAPLAQALHATHSMEVESNGTQIPHQIHHTFVSSHYPLLEWNISPKGENAGQKLEINALLHWAELSKSRDCKVNFKFVVRREFQDKDVSEIESLIENAKIPTEKIFVMSEGTHLESQLSNQWLETICLSKGWRMTTRLHILTHGEKRGV